MRRVIQFLQEVKAEFKNISWPKKDALIQLTFVVISISIIVSLILGGFDYLFTQGINLIGVKKTTVPTSAPSSILPTLPPLESTPSATLAPTKTKTK